MKTADRLYLIFALLACTLLLFTGCQITNFKASEVHQVMSVPLVFKQTIHAEGISKVTEADGTVKRKAKTLSHDLAIFGFERNSTYKDAELETEPEKK